MYLTKSQYRNHTMINADETPQAYGTRDSVQLVIYQVKYFAMSEIMYFIHVVDSITTIKW